MTGANTFAAQLTALVGPTRVRAGVPLAPFTTFHVGGAADWLVDLRTVEELQAALSLAAHAGVPVTVLGGGSNVLVADEGVRGLVVRLRLMDLADSADGTVRAGAGVTINGLVRWMVGRGLEGLEAWAGTPGTVGGAIYGNAHWAGENIGDRVARVMLASSEGMLQVVNQAEMGFAYDTSRVQRTREIVVWAEFVVSPGEVATLRARARESLAYRKRTQPLASPSAGCIFQNPDPRRDTVPAGVPPSAGALIDRAGLKGRHCGGAMISTDHANFVVNDGRATARDIRTLIETARAAVHERFGILLRDEVVYLGQF
jgi:UDP-N-acetylmuramate dehydrogenase